MDYLVSVNVDQFLLDCLEDELPCVTFPPIDLEDKGSSALDLIQDYHSCTSMLSGTGKGNWGKVKPTGSTNSRKNSLASLAANSEEDEKEQRAEGQ